MKKLLLLSACAIFAFSACKKDSPKTTPSNTITATVGGSNINFSTGAAAELATDSGLYILDIEGASGTTTSAQSINIGLLAQGPIVKGTYTINSSTNPNVTVIPDVAYTKSLSGDDSDFFETDLNFDIPGGNLSTTTTVTITSISTTNVQGTFSGVLLNDADGTTTATVTNGKFNVTVSAAKTTQSFNSHISAGKMLSLKNRLRN